MVDYYHIRKITFQKVKDHLIARQQAMDAGREPPDFTAFELQLMMELGVSERMIKHTVEKLTDGGTVKKGKIVRIEAEQDEEPTIISDHPETEADDDGDPA